MKVICSKCGTIGEEDAMRCTSCGATLEYNDIVNTTNNTAVAVNNSSKKSNKALIAVAVVVILVIGGAVASGIAIANKNSYKSVIEEKLYAIETLDAEKIVNTFPKFIYEGAEEVRNYESYDVFVQQMKEVGVKNIEEKIFNEIEKTVGDDLKFSYEINKLDDLSEKKLEFFCKALEELYEYSADEIKDVKKAEIKVTVKGSNGSEYDFNWYDVYLIKEGKKWYLLNTDFERCSIKSMSEYYNLFHIDWYEVIEDYYYEHKNDDN